MLDHEYLEGFFDHVLCLDKELTLLKLMTSVLNRLRLVSKASYFESFLQDGGVLALGAVEAILI